MAQIKATIDRLEEDKVVLIFANGQQLILDKNNFDFEIKEGKVIYLSLSQAETETKEKENLAKNILKEILKKEND